MINKMPPEARAKYYEEHDYPRDGYNRGGYEWCIEHWGTKWGICNPKLVSKRTRQLKYTFDCAWSPCCPIVHKMSELFPKLKFKLRYFECGITFQGTFICENSEILEDTTSSYRGSRGG